MLACGCSGDSFDEGKDISIDTVHHVEAHDRELQWTTDDDDSWGALLDDDWPTSTTDDDDSASRTTFFEDDDENSSPSKYGTSSISSKVGMYTRHSRTLGVTRNPPWPTELQTHSRTFRRRNSVPLHRLQFHYAKGTPAYGTLFYFILCRLTNLSAPH